MRTSDLFLDPNIWLAASFLIAGLSCIGWSWRRARLRVAHRNARLKKLASLAQSAGPANPEADWLGADAFIVLPPPLDGQRKRPKPGAFYLD